MNILFYGQNLDAPRWIESLRKVFPTARVEAWSEQLPDTWQADYALLWHPPAELFHHQTRLKAIFNLGAGVDALVRLPERPVEVPLIKLRNAGMDEWMFDYVLYGVLHFSRGFDRYRAQQCEARWQPLDCLSKDRLRIGVLGLGALGGAIARRLTQYGFQVQGWSRTPNSLEGVDTYSGPQALPAFLGRSEFLVNLLPDTEATRHLLDETRLSQLPKDAVLINVGRGSTLDQDALLAALESGRLRGAQLDVFAEEPLPSTHPLWFRPEVIVTPHIAAPTQVDDAVSQIAADIDALENGLYVPRVDIERGY